MFRQFLYQFVISFYIVDFDINESARNVVYDIGPVWIVE